MYIGNTQAQNIQCETCDSVITLSGAQFGSGNTYQWTCSDGQTSTSQNPTFDVDSTISCTVIVTDTVSGCSLIRGVDIIKCWECIATVYVTLQNTTLLAATANCQDTTPYYTWEKLNNNVWLVVNTNSSTYNTNGQQGTYRVTANCGINCTAVDTFVYEGPCGAMSVKLEHVVPSQGYINGIIRATVTGCFGNINYKYYRRPTWISEYGPFPEREITTTSISDSLGAGTAEPYVYKVVASCGACIDSTTITTTVQPPCSQGSATLTATATNFPADQRVSFNMSVFAIRGINNNGPYYNLQHYYGPGYGSNRNIYSGSLNIVTNISFPEGNHRIILTATTLGCTFLDTVDLVVTTATCNNFLTQFTSSGTQGCLRNDVLFEGTAVGGTAPYTWNWTAQLGSGAPFSLGSSNRFSMPLPSLGTYAVTMTVTDKNGCVKTKTGSVTVVACDCNCEGSLGIFGCQLLMTFSGNNCIESYNYALEYSANNGNTWSTVVAETPIPTTFLAGYWPTLNGIYRLKLIQKKDGCVTKEYLPVNVTCYVPPCTSQPTLTLNGTGQQFCGTATATVSGNTFGGSATSVTLTENGAGSLNISTANSSPFTFIYTPDVSDAGKIITVTVTTNNPNGGLCIAQTKTYALDFRLFITPQVIVGDTLCFNTQRSLSGYPAGGTFTATGAGVISNGNILTSTEIGPTVVTYTVTTNGCTGSSSATVYSSYCCNCAPAALTLVDGCYFTYGNCANWIAQMQIDTAQNGTWVNWNSNEVMRGSLTFPYKFRESANYRVRYTSATCGIAYSNTVSVTNSNIISHTNYCHFNMNQDYGEELTRILFTCLPQNEIVLHFNNAPAPTGPNPPYSCTNAGGNGYYNTWNSSIPVTWTVRYMTDASSKNVTIGAMSSTSLTLNYEWVGGQDLGLNLCATTPDLHRFYIIIEARDACNKLVYKAHTTGFGGTTN